MSAWLDGCGLYPGHAWLAGIQLQSPPLLPLHLPLLLLLLLLCWHHDHIVIIAYACFYLICWVGWFRACRAVHVELFRVQIHESTLIELSQLERVSCSLFCPFLSACKLLVEKISSDQKMIFLLRLARSFFPARSFISQVCKAIRHTMPCKQKMLGKEMADYFSGKKFIKYMEDSEFHVAQGGKLLSSRSDCVRLAALMVRDGVIKRGVIEEKTIKRKTGKIKKKKILLYYPPNQQGFADLDVDEPYIWCYNPVQAKTVYYGLMVLAAIVCCAALPLWPIWLRNSVAGVLLFIVAGRPLLQLIVYLVTFSRWHFMIMPNLDEERPMAFSKRFSPVFVLERSNKGEGDDEDGDGSGDEGGDGDDQDGDAGDGDDE